MGGEFRLSKTIYKLGFLTRGESQSADTYNSTTDWRDADAECIGAIINGNTVYGGTKLDSQIVDGVSIIKGAKCSRVSEEENSTVLASRDVIPLEASVTPSLYYEVSGGDKCGMYVASNQFIATVGKTIDIELSMSGRVDASTDAGWCWSGVGWKFTDEKYISTPIIGFNDSINGGGGGGKFPAGSGDYWYNTENIGSNTSCENGFNGVLKAPQITTGPNGKSFDYSTTVTMTVPSGTSFLTFYYIIHASGGDFASVRISSASYKVKKIYE